MPIAKRRPQGIKLLSAREAEAARKTAYKGPRTIPLSQDFYQRLDKARTKANWTDLVNLYRQRANVEERAKGVTFRKALLSQETDRALEITKLLRAGGKISGDREVKLRNGLMSPDEAKRRQSFRELVTIVEKHNL